MKCVTAPVLSLLCAAVLLGSSRAASDHAAELTTALLEFIVKTGGRENRIVQTVCPGLAEVHVNRTALNHGFHRDVVTEVTLPVSMATPPLSCRLLLVDTVPAGMYVDLHQVTFRTDFGGPQVLALRDIDVEQAAHLSPNHTLLMYSPLQQSPKGFTWRVVLPVHLCLPMSHL
ncbi:GPI alpha-1,4-mannosyltransferase I, stabilizing subunit-like [Branchiostoma floridae x Branchiostoma belcheri]